MISIPVSKFRAELKHWLESAQNGEEIVITDHGKPLARVVSAGQMTAFERLVREGVIRRPQVPKGTVSARPTIRPRGSVSEIVSEQRD